MVSSFSEGSGRRDLFADDTGEDLSPWRQKWRQARIVVCVYRVMPKIVCSVLLSRVLRERTGLGMVFDDRMAPRW